MNYSLEQLPSGRWGIYTQLRFIASIGCHQTGLKILTRLQQNHSIPNHASISSEIVPQSDSSEQIA